MIQQIEVSNENLFEKSDVYHTVESCTDQLDGSKQGNIWQIGKLSSNEHWKQ